AYRLDRDSDRWIPLLDHVGWEDWGHNGVLSLASDPVEPNRVYAAVGMYTVDWDPNNGAILRSDDYGETWEKTELPFKVGGNMPGRGIGERLQVDPADNDIRYYGAEGGHGLWRSTDKGATWSQVSSFPNSGTFAPDPDSDYVLDQQELGVLWTVFDSRSATAGEGTSTLFTAVADTENPLYRSDDGGPPGHRSTAPPPDSCRTRAGSMRTAPSTSRRQTPPVPTTAPTGRCGATRSTTAHGTTSRRSTVPWARTSGSPG